MTYASYVGFFSTMCDAILNLFWNCLDSFRLEYLMIFRKKGGRRLSAWGCQIFKSAPAYKQLFRGKLPPTYVLLRKSSKTR